MEQVERFPQAEDKKYKRIFGGIAMPSAKAAGFALVLGETRELGFEGKPKFVHLDEVERWDSREFIECVAKFDYRYRPNQWWGDTRNVALEKYVREFNRETLGVEDLKAGWRGLKVTLSGLLLGREKDNPFSFIVPDLNKLLGGSDRNLDRQRLFLKEGSRLMAYMKSPQLGDAVEMTFDAFPAVSALAFTALGMERQLERDNQGPRQTKTNNEYSRI